MIYRRHLVTRTCFRFWFWSLAEIPTFSACKWLWAFICIYGHQSTQPRWPTKGRALSIFNKQAKSATNCMQSLPRSFSKGQFTVKIAPRRNYCYCDEVLPCVKMFTFNTIVLQKVLVGDAGRWIVRWGPVVLVRYLLSSVSLRWKQDPDASLFGKTFYWPCYNVLEFGQSRTAGWKDYMELIILLKEFGNFAGQPPK